MPRSSCRIGRSVGELAPELVLFVAGAGAASAFQSAFNGRITRATGDPLTATAVNGAVGAIGATGDLGSMTSPSSWLYTGDALGVTVVLTMRLPPSGRSSSTGSSTTSHRQPAWWPGWR